MPLISSSRGCYGNCDFCTTPAFYNRKWRSINPIKVVDEIEFLIKKYGTKQFYITDDQFAGIGNKGKQHILSIINEIIRRGLNNDNRLHFFIMIRADFFNYKNEDVIKLFPQVGFNDIFIGFETGSEANNELYNKGNNIDINIRALNLLRKYNIFVEGGFIIFNPYSTFDSLIKDANFIKYLGVPLFGYYTKEILVYPGTNLFKRLKDENLLDKWSYKDIQFKYISSSVRQLRDYLVDFFKKFEDTDNQVFELIDFKIKLERILPKIENLETRKEAESFIIKMNIACERLNNINYEYFISLLRYFKESKEMPSEVDFIESHKLIYITLANNYRILNNELNLI